MFLLIDFIAIRSLEIKFIAKPNKKNKRECVSLYTHRFNQNTVMVLGVDLLKVSGRVLYGKTGSGKWGEMPNSVQGSTAGLLALKVRVFQNKVTLYTVLCHEK